MEEKIIPRMKQYHLSFAVHKCLCAFLTDQEFTLDDFNEELDVDVEFDVELELVEDDELDEELELVEDDELDEELELDEDDVLGVGGVCSFSPNPSPVPDSNLNSRVKLRGAGKLVAVHVSVL